MILNLKNLVEEELLTKALEEIEILDEAGCDLNQELILSGELTPVFFWICNDQLRG